MTDDSLYDISIYKMNPFRRKNKFSLTSRYCVIENYSLPNKFSYTEPYHTGASMIQPQTQSPQIEAVIDKKFLNDIGSKSYFSFDNANIGKALTFLNLNQSVRIACSRLVSQHTKISKKQHQFNFNLVIIMILAASIENL